MGRLELACSVGVGATALGSELARKLGASGEISGTHLYKVFADGAYTRRCTGIPDPALVLVRSQHHLVLPRGRLMRATRFFPVR